MFDRAHSADEKTDVMMLKSQVHAGMGLSRGPDSGTGVPALKDS
jgi:hypothetical protein